MERHEETDDQQDNLFDSKQSASCHRRLTVLLHCAQHVDAQIMRLVAEKCYYEYKIERRYVSYYRY